MTPAARLGIAFALLALAVMLAEHVWASIPTAAVAAWLADTTRRGGP